MLLYLTYFSVMFRWEELHTLASEPTDRHVFFAEDIEDATNGLYTTLAGSTICSAAFPGQPNKFILCSLIKQGLPSAFGGTYDQVGLFLIRVPTSLRSLHL